MTLNFWRALFAPYCDARIAVVGLLGFSSGLPLLLTGSTLGYWFAREGMALKDVGLLSLASLPYALKFVWAPFVDRLNLPLLTPLLGRRRAWLFLSQLALVILLASLSRLHPSQGLSLIIPLVMAVVFASATQDIVMLAYQVERLQKNQYGSGEATAILGYRMGILMAGAGAFYLSSMMSWNEIYLVMAGVQSLGLLTTLFCKEPDPIENHEARLHEEKARAYLHAHPRLHGSVARILSWFYGALVCPFRDYMTRPDWVWGLAVLFLFKLGDNLIGSMSNIYYADLGYTTIEIANASKVFGMWALLIGGVIGGALMSRLGMLTCMFWFAALHGLTTLGYIALAYGDTHPLWMLYTFVAFDSVTGGMRITAFFAYQLTLVSPVYAATQLAFLTSVHHLGRTIFSSSSGFLVEAMGWTPFFAITSLASIPALLIVAHLNRRTQPLTNIPLMPTYSKETT